MYTMLQLYNSYPLDNRCQAQNLFLDKDPKHTEVSTALGEYKSQIFRERLVIGFPQGSLLVKHQLVVGV